MAERVLTIVAGVAAAQLAYDFLKTAKATKEKKEDKTQKKEEQKEEQEDQERSLSNWEVEHVPSESGPGEYWCRVFNDKESFNHATLVDVDGVALPAQMAGHGHYQWLRQNVRFREGDVCVATYPKCGTTWVENILVLLLNGLDAPLDPLSKNTYNPETGVGKIWPLVNVWQDPNDATLTHDKGEFKLRMNLDEFNKVKGRRLIKSHMPRHMLLGADPSTNKIEHAKVVCVARGAKDACVSFYHHWKPMFPLVPFDAFATLWLSGNMSWGSWFEHTTDWFEASKSDDNILFITYESLKADPTGVIAKIAKHIGVEADASRCQAVADKSSFREMRTLAEKAEAKGGSGHTSHLRSGKVGGWRAHFTTRTAGEFDSFSRLRSRLPFPVDFGV